MEVWGEGDGREKAPRARIAANEADADELAGTSATGETQSLEDPEPTTGSVKKKIYVRELERLQIDLVKQQETIRREGHKVVESDSKAARTPQLHHASAEPGALRGAACRGHRPAAPAGRDRLCPAAHVRAAVRAVGLLTRSYR